MPPKSDRLSETDIALATMAYLASLPDREAEIGAIVAALPGYLTFQPADRAPSDTRRKEEVWEQQVRNIVSHKNTPGNFIHEGYLEHRPKGRLYLTDVGLAHLKNAGLHT